MKKNLKSSLLQNPENKNISDAPARRSACRIWVIQRSAAVLRNCQFYPFWALAQERVNFDHRGVPTHDLRNWSPLLHRLSYKARTGAGRGYWDVMKRWPCSTDKLVEERWSIPKVVGSNPTLDLSIVSASRPTQVSCGPSILRPAGFLIRPSKLLLVAYRNVQVCSSDVTNSGNREHPCSSFEVVSVGQSIGN